MLSIGGIVGLIGQMPGGAIIDAARRERLVAGFAVGAIGVAALAYAAWPIFPVIAAAATLHAMASCVLGPAIAAISLGLVGPAAIGERFGRNARFASLGNGFAAALMGACGYFLSSRSVFLATFVLVILTIIALSRISDREIDPDEAHGSIIRAEPDPEATSVLHLLAQRPLLIFAGSVLLLQLANAAMLPLMAGIVTTRSSQWAPVLIAACIILPQAIVALSSPSVGRKAQQWGRRPLLLIGFGALAIRGVLFATVTDPYLLVAVQVLRRRYRRGIRRPDPADRRRYRLRQRAFQSRAGRGRHRNGDRRLLEQCPGRLCQRPSRPQRGVPRPVGDRMRRPVA